MNRRTRLRGYGSFWRKGSILLVGVLGLLLALGAGMMARKYTGMALALPDQGSQDMPVPRFRPLVFQRKTLPKALQQRSASKKAKRTSRSRPALPASTHGIRRAREDGLQKAQNTLASQIKAHYGKGRAWRMIIETDKPLYQPGETIWVRAIQVRLKGDLPHPKDTGAYFELIDPRGSPIQKLQVRMKAGHGHIQFDLPAGSVGGEYTIQVTDFLTHAKAQKKITVSAYQPPRIKKKLEFVRKGYGAGDTVQATLELRGATGSALTNHPIQIVASLDGREIRRWSEQTPATGDALIAFSLPKQLDTDDGLLTVLVTEGGVTESISRSIPLVVKRIKVGFFPEGGKAVIGLPSRVYFAARRIIDEKPIDLEGEIQDNEGDVVARIRSFHDGMGRFLYTPKKGKRYHLRITRPMGIEQKFALPEAAATGITMQMVDDFRSVRSDLRIIVHSKRAQSVTVTALQRENLIAHRAYRLQKGRQYLSLPTGPLARGIVRLTLWDGAAPLAERLVFCARDRQLRFEILTDKQSYQPRDTVQMKIRVRDASGRVLPRASLGISVVDDTVLNFADDHEPNLLAQRYLSGQLVGKIYKPNFYFDPKKDKAYEALDLVMGTHGWRDFSWQSVRTDQEPPKIVSLGPDVIYPEGSSRWDRRRMAVPETKRPARMPPQPMQPEAPLPQAPLPQAPHGLPKDKEGKKQPKLPDRRIARLENAAKPQQEKEAAKRQNAPANLKVDRDIVAKDPPPAAMPIERPPRKVHRRRALMARGRRWGGYYRRYYWAYARTFPVQFYDQQSAFQGTRSDFRETISWHPQIVTDAWGEAKITFGLNDSITSFRIGISGLGAGLWGMHHQMITSKRPFYMVVKLPLEVSAGDGMALPLTLRNDTKHPLTLKIDASFSPLFRLLENPLPQDLRLPAGEARTYFYPVQVHGRRGVGKISFHARSEGISDSFEQQIKIRPRGFPRDITRSGMLDGQRTQTVELMLPQDIREAAPQGEVILYPSPLSNLIQGIASMLRQPYGCFEQASSGNYPNVMIVSYLRHHNVRDPKIMRRAYALLDDGYRKLAGYESRQRGYEWFGGSPGHEALTAYGVMQFLEMKKIYPKVSHEMLKRTVGWLLQRRDGKGGYLRNPRALDSFGAADRHITNAYITFALAESGRKDIQSEVKWLEDQALGSADPYFLSLVLNAILQVRGKQDKVAAALLKKLLSLQQADGSFRGTHHSITRSSGSNLWIETSALAILALLRAEASADRAMRAIQWLNQNRNLSGGFGATQATILSLRALIAYEEANRRPKAPGKLSIAVNGEIVDSIDYGTDSNQPIISKKFAQALKPGRNKIALTLLSETGLPYSFGLRYHTRKPLSHAGVAVSLETRLSSNKTKMGELVRLRAILQNKTANGQPMTLARIAFPGALTYQSWQLKEMREKKLFDFYETREREVIVYFRALAPHARHLLNFDLVGHVTGNYTSAASQAYLYYTDDKKSYTAPLAVSVSP